MVTADQAKTLPQRHESCWTQWRRTCSAEVVEKKEAMSLQGAVQHALFPQSSGRCAQSLCRLSASLPRPSVV
jgi:hypothetical protein